MGSGVGGGTAQWRVARN